VNTNFGELPILHAGLPIWYQGRLAAVAVDGEVYSVGWVEPGDRAVLRAMALAALEAPQLTPDQQFSFAAYYLLSEEVWNDLRALPDELIARREGVPVELVRRRRSLPDLMTGATTANRAPVCA